MYLQNILGENLGSGHFYLAKNRTFLLCVDSPRFSAFLLEKRRVSYLAPESERDCTHQKQE